MVETDNGDLQDFGNVLVRIDMVLCNGKDVLRYCEGMDRAGEKVDALRRPLETCLDDKDILTKVFIYGLDILSLLSSTSKSSIHQVVVPPQLRTRSAQARPFRSKPSVVTVTNTISRAKLRQRLNISVNVHRVAD